MGHDKAMSPQAVFMQMLMGRWVSQALTCAASLGVADHMTKGPTTADDLAAKTGASADGVNRLMRALAAAGVFEETAPRTYALTPVSELLRTDVPGSVRGMARWLGSTTACRVWTEFEQAVRTGSQVAEKVLGAPLFEHFKRDAAEGEIFNGAMTSFSGHAAAEVAAAYDVAWARRIVDVGGGHGMLLAKLLEKAKEAQGVLFDLPEVVRGASAILEAHGVAGRVECVGGSFFETVPEGADLYVMKHILHDWDDARCLKILELCRARMKAGGRVAVLEMIVPEGPEPDLAKFLDLEMLAMAPGGRERTREQFAALFARAGLRLARVVATRSPVNVIEAVVA